MVTNLELFNWHQQDVRNRAGSLAKSIFLLAGGTLTVSIGIFAGPSAPSLNSDLSFALKASWWCLFFAITFLLLALLVAIIRDYAFGERWRKHLDDEAVVVTDSPSWIEVVIWVLGLVGVAAFLTGLFGQAYVASNAI
ncbi:MAG: hypothetical protein ACR2FI_12220 [Burkholderiales bacterium]